MEIDLSCYVRVIWRWRWLVLLSMVLAAGASLYAVRAMPQTYRSSVFLMVGEDTANPAVRQDDLTATQRVMVSYMNMVKRQPVLEATVAALKLPISWRTLQEQVAAVRVENSNVFEIRAIDTSAAGVRAIADEIARQLVLQSPTLANIQQDDEKIKFIQSQLDTLQLSIQQGEAELADKRAALAREVSARGVLERQDEIRAIEAKLSSWRASYAALLPAAAQTRGANSLTIVERAYVPTQPISPNVPMTVVLAIAVGALLAIVAAFVLEFLDDTLHGPDDVARGLALPVIGSIRTVGRLRHPKQGLVTLHDPFEPVAEAFRMLRTFIELAGARTTPIVLMVTSPSLGEGKSFTSANLAVSFAQAGRRTILVDADLRHPTVHRMFEAPDTAGLATMLAAGPGGHDDAPQVIDRQLNDLLSPTSLPNLQLLASGPIPPNPAELLGNRTLGPIFDRLRARADVVVVDCPPVLPVADTTILAAYGAMLLLVVEAGKTRAGAARKALDSLHRADAVPIGVVVNRAEVAESEYHRYQPLEVEAPTGRRFGSRLRLIRRG